MLQFPSDRSLTVAARLLSRARQRAVKLPVGIVGLLLLTALCLGQGARPLENVRVRQLGEQLVCLCGCGSSVTSCNMLQCHFSEPAREQLLAMVSAGMSDQAIFDAFVEKYGKQVLMRPPAEGFNLLGYVMPFIAILLGLALVWWLIQRFRRPLAVAAGPQVDDAELDRYRERIENDLEKLN
jgi:cytochrome c-type biogenesis protein CcmH